MLDGELNQLNKKCHTRTEQLVEQIKTGAEITEELKSTDQMKWIALMNNVRSAAEEVVIKELVYM